MTDRDDIRATVQARTRDLLLALWRAAPDGVRGEVEAIGKAHKSGELAPMGVTDRLGPLLRERWPVGFDVAAQFLPGWALVARRPR